MSDVYPHQQDWCTATIFILIPLAIHFQLYDHTHYKYKHFTAKQGRTCLVALTQ